MKTIFTTTVAIAAVLIASAASASDAPTALSTSVADTCAVTGAAVAVQNDAGATVTSGFATPGPNGGTTTIAFSGALVDPVTARPAWTDYGNDNFIAGSKAVTLEIPAHCNYAGSVFGIRSENGGLRRQGGLAGSEGNFADGIAMAMRVQRNTGSGNTTVIGTNTFRFANETSLGLTVRPWNGQLRVQVRPVRTFRSNGLFTNQAATTPLLAGTYTDTVRLRFGFGLF